MVAGALLLPLAAALGDAALAEAARAAYDEASDYRVEGSELAELHFVLWKPDRVLAEVEAKRRIVDECVSTFELNAGDAVNSEAVWLAEAVLKASALPYADRDGYREEWRP